MFEFHYNKQILKLIAAILLFSFHPCGLGENSTDDQHLYSEDYGPLEITEKDHYLFDFSWETEKQFARRGLIHNDPQLNEYVSGIAEKLFPETPDEYIEYRIHLLRDPAFNAFALPDGQIYIFTGSLAALQNEAQLAGLIAHEINHVAGHHGILATRSAKKKAIASMVLGTILGGVGTNAAVLLSAGIDTALLMSMLSYSRSNEEEADRNAVHRLLSLGYDVNQFSRMFSLMAEDPEGEQAKGWRLWRTHPQSEDRAQYISMMIGEISLPEHLDKRDSPFNMMTKEISVLTMRDHIGRDYPKTAISMAQRFLLNYPDESRAHLVLGDALKLLGPRSLTTTEVKINNKEKKRNIKERRKYTRGERIARLLETEQGRQNNQFNLKSAESAYKRVLATNPNQSVAHRGLAEVYAGLGQYKASAKSYMKYLKFEPDALDKQEIIQKLSLLIQQLKATKESSNE